MNFEGPALADQYKPNSNGFVLFNTEVSHSLGVIGAAL